MASKPSAPVIILILFLLISLSLAANGFYLFQKERKKTLDLEVRLEDLNSKQRVTETKLKESEKLISELQAKLQDAKTQADSLIKELQLEKTAKLEAQANAEQLRMDLEQQKGSRSDLEKKLNLAQEEQKKIQERLKELNSQKQELEEKIKGLEAKSQGVELGTIVVSPETAPSEPKAKTESLEGKVLVINKDYNFAVLNLGGKDGVNAGDVFTIYHSNKYVGEVKVEKVHDSMSAAGFLSADIKDKISEGDKVVQKVK